MPSLKKLRDAERELEEIHRLIESLRNSYYQLKQEQIDITKFLYLLRSWDEEFGNSFNIKALSILSSIIDHIEENTDLTSFLKKKTTK